MSPKDAPQPPPAGGEDEIAVGRVAAPYGLRGEVRVEPLTDDPERLTRLREVRLEMKGGERRAARIEEAGIDPAGRVTVKFGGYEDRDSAGALRGAYVLIPRAEAVALPPGHYFVDDIVGLQVRTVAGAPLGVVREVLQTGANDVYVTEQVLVPATREVVREIDLAAGVMVVDLPEMI